MKRSRRLRRVTVAGALACCAAGGLAAAAVPASASAAESAAHVELTMPDVVLVDQDGVERNFATDVVGDGVVAMNFVFTTCTTICPPMGANFGRLQDLLGDRLGSDVKLISVSLDPKVDTPGRLKAWSKPFGRREGWTLLTGEVGTVESVLRQLGALTPDKVDHAPIVLIGNAGTGEWIRVYGLAPPAKLLEAIDAVAAGTPAPAPVSSAADASSPGEGSGSCH